MSEEQKINRKGHLREQEGGKKTIKMTADYEFVCVCVHESVGGEVLKSETKT